MSFFAILISSSFAGGGGNGHWRRQCCLGAGDTVVFHKHPCSLLGCTLQAGSPCSCPASGPRGEPRGMDGGSYMSEARSWSDSPPHATDGGQDMPAAPTPRGGDVTSYRGEASDWHIGYQGS